MEVCPGKGVGKAGNSYKFTLEDGSIIEMVYAEDTGVCTVTGDGLQTGCCLSDHASLPNERLHLQSWSS